MLRVHSKMLKGNLWEGNSALHLWQCGEEKCARNHSYGPAVRNHFLIHCVLEGYGIFEAGGVRYRLGPGQAFLIRPQEMVYYEADSVNPWHYCWVGFQGTEAERTLELMGVGESPILKFQGDEEVRKCILRMQENFEGGGSRFEALSALYHFLSLLENRAGGADRREEIAQTAAGYILENYSYPITMEQVASYVGVHRSQLFRKFKEGYGMAPQQYLIEVRLMKAQELLKKGLSVTETAYSVGFGDVTNFSRQFRQRLGMAPLFWQKEWNDQNGDEKSEKGPAREKF